MDENYHRMPAASNSAAADSISNDNDSTYTNNDTRPPNQAPAQQDEQQHSLLAVILVFLAPALGGLLFGYDIAATSFVLQALLAGNTDSNDDATASWTNTISSSPVWQGVVVSLSSSGAWVSSWVLFAAHDRIGRRTELQIGAVLYMAGALLEYVAGLPMFLNQSGASLPLFLLVLGRFVYGWGIGVSMHAAPTYLGEMGPTSIRGLLVSLKEASIVLGMVLGYTLGYANKDNWRLTYVSSMVPSLAMLILSTCIPESCRWLLLQGSQEYQEQALLSLKFVFPHGDEASRQLSEIQASLFLQQQDASTSSSQPGFVEREPLLLTDDANNSNSSNNSSWKALMDPKYRSSLVVGFGLVLLQQITGQPSVLSYATQIFTEAGLAGSAAIAVALFKLVATLSAAVTVERYGRTKLLTVGCLLMLMALILLTTTFATTRSFVPFRALLKCVTLLAMFAYIGGYQVGFGPVVWLLISEVYSLPIRGQAVALSVQLNFLVNALVQFGVPVLQQWLGLSGTFGIFALLDLYSIFFIRMYVPETKGLTLEQIEECFAQRNRARLPSGDSLNPTTTGQTESSSTTVNLVI